MTFFGWSPVVVLAALAGLLAVFGLPLIPARLARAKGRSALGFYLFGLCCFLPALITVLIITENPSGLERQRQQLRAGRAPSDVRQG